MPCHPESLRESRATLNIWPEFGQVIGNPIGAACQLIINSDRVRSARVGRRRLVLTKTSEGIVRVKTGAERP